MHRYLIRLRNSGQYNPGGTVYLLVQLRSEVDEFRGVVKNLRVTNEAIEFDLYALNEELKVQSLSKLTKNFGELLTERNLEIDQINNDKRAVIKSGIELFNQERYWECHETVEQIWRREARGLEKDVQQGFILAASALVHFQKDEQAVCLGMIPRALTKLDQWKAPLYYDLNVEKLKNELNGMLASKMAAPFKI